MSVASFKCKWCDKEYKEESRLNHHRTTSKVCLKIKEKIEQREEELKDKIFLLECNIEERDDCLDHFREDISELEETVQRYKTRLEMYKNNCSEEFIIEVIKKYNSLQSSR